MSATEFQQAEIAHRRASTPQGGGQADALAWQCGADMTARHPAAEPPAALQSTLGLKRAFDIAGASLLIILAAPLMLILALLIRFSNGSPALIGHARVGYRGRAFRCLKFRSMVADADQVLKQLLSSDPIAHEEWRRTRKLSDDPRITRVGRFLRVTSLDELPQLFNVLRGDMSLVGPRPVVLEELIEHYGQGASRYYLSVRPGITGLWQASGRSDTSYAERVALDIAYVRGISISRDLVILCRTVTAVLARRGAR